MSRRTAPPGQGWGLLGSCPVISPLPRVRPPGICRNGRGPCPVRGPERSVGLYLIAPPPADLLHLCDRCVGKRENRLASFVSRMFSQVWEYQPFGKRPGTPPVRAGLPSKVRFPWGNSSARPCSPAGHRLQHVLLHQVPRPPAGTQSASPSVLGPRGSGRLGPV